MNEKKKKKQFNSQIHNPDIEYTVINYKREKPIII